MSYYEWAPYVPVAERRRKAEQAMEKQRKKGQAVSPVIIKGRTIAGTFWGKAWCENLEHYSDFANRLPRGRTYVRNGSVIDLQIAPGLVRAQVSGSDIYQVQVKVKPVPGPQWKALCVECGGAVASLVELLQGRFSKGVMERLCRQGTGLFPAPKDIAFSCSCPDGASMCKHVAAVLYGIGARFDAEPEWLFALRGVEGRDLLAQAAAGVALAAPQAASDRRLEEDDLSALFGLELASPGDPAPTEAKRVPEPVKPAAEAPRPAKAKRGRPAPVESKPKPKPKPIPKPKTKPVPSKPAAPEPVKAKQVKAKAEPKVKPRAKPKKKKPTSRVRGVLC